MARGNKPKDLEYLKNNPIVSNFVDDVNGTIRTYYAQHLTNLTPEELTVDVGIKFIRLWAGTRCWGFISRIDGDHKGVPIKRGDLLKPATWKAPAKHARGNIADGTAKWTYIGVNYL
jgi:hypothetical protein